MRCPHCGHDNAPEARFCANCGLELPEPTSLQAGQTMHNGQYRIVRQLGKGGMGTIYLAENRQAFDRLCVIKELIAYYEPGDELRARTRFEAEARTLAALKHPGIPDMYGYFSEGGHNFIVMEYIEGENLQQILDGANPPGPALSVENAVRYTVEVCRVLEYLAGVQPEPVVHCDIKPANIIIDRNSGQAVLVDFGTAKARYAQAAAAAARAQQPDADRPSVYGTVGYAAPELFRGLAEPRSDVFALAATLYALLTQDDPMEHPFKWPAMDSVPAPLRLILRHALANDAAERSSAEQLRRQLEAYRASQAGTVRPLTFPQGDQATTVTGVLDLSLRHWDYARQILYDGSLDAWLRQTLNDPVAANRAREALQSYPDLPDAGLDAFLRGLNPRIPQPDLTVEPERLDLGRLRPGKTSRATLTLRNRGPVGARGTIESDAPWLEVAPKVFGLAPGAELKVVARVVQRVPLRAGKTHRAAIRVKPAEGPERRAVVALRVERGTAPTVSPPAAGRPTTPAPTRTPQGTRPSRPAAPPQSKRRVRVGLVLGGLILLAAVALGLTYVYQNLVRPSEATLQRGVELFQAGQRDRALRLLSALRPTDTEYVRRVGWMLEQELVPLEGGTLIMGSDEIGVRDRRPAHPVEVDALSIQRYEVTNVQYLLFMRVTGHPPPAHWRDGVYPRGQALYPVVSVTWHDAAAYARWAGKRLPSEAEWAWAVRGAEGRLYPWGDERDEIPAHTQERGASGPTRVGSYGKGATPEGVMDLAGNVREWTADVYGLYEMPHRPPEEGEFMAVRGGSWATPNDYATARWKMPRDEAASDLGFRLVAQ